MSSDCEGKSNSNMSPLSPHDDTETGSIDELESDVPLTIPSPLAKTHTELCITIPKPTADISKKPTKVKATPKGPAKKKDSTKKPPSDEDDEAELAQSQYTYAAVEFRSGSCLILYHTEIIFLVPVAKSAAIQHITFTTDTMFSDAIDTIHDTIGCVSVPQKPELTYHLSTSPQKSSPINLNNEEDWSRCLDDIAGLEKKKRATVSVIIIVSENVHLRYSQSCPYAQYCCYSTWHL